MHFLFSYKTIIKGTEFYLGIYTRVPFFTYYENLFLKKICTDMNVDEYLLSKKYCCQEFAVPQKSYAK